MSGTWPPDIADPQHVDNPPSHTPQVNHDHWDAARYDAANTNTKAPVHHLITPAVQHVETYIPILDAHQFRPAELLFG